MTDGTNAYLVNITTSFNGGAWMHIPISVPAGGSVTVRVTRTAGVNALLSGVFLGDGPTPAPEGYGTGVQGDWVGAYGAAGHLLAAWNGTSDLVLMPNVQAVLEQGARFRWSALTGEVRALEDPAQSQRRAATYFDATEVRLRLNFAAAYTGTLHIYVLDWDNNDRRQTITVSGGGATPQVTAITTNFREGAWIHVPISVQAGGSVIVRATRTAGANAVLSGVFLGN